MPDFCSIVLITAVSFTATLISSMSGGGSSMITTPVWLMLGFPLPVAIATNTINGSIWTLVAARNYLRGQHIDWKLAVLFAFCGLTGAFFATKIVVSADPKVLQHIFGVIILCLASLVFFRKDFGLKSQTPRLGRITTGLCAFPFGFYEAFFGSGNGIFTSALLCTARGFLLIEALGYYYLVSCAWCVFASCLYVAGGNWNLPLILSSMFGSVCGAGLGSKIGRQKGGGFVKTLFLIVGTILGLKLLFGI
jgi:uncharacterized protein